MTITYTVGNSLYVNTTNRCSNSCDFCVRSHGEELYGDLWLDREPTREEILNDIEKRRLEDYDELVFCGYGEPAERLDDILWVCRKLKSTRKIKIRMNTNGQSDLINKRDTAPDFEGLFDVVSISLNCATAESYQAVCHSEFGEEAFEALISFARRVKEYVPSVVFSVVRGSIPDTDIDICQKIANKNGVTLRVREML
ncbi:MAG: radical SAM protein [Clostridiales bacterium]|nr:radical SAM protein [Clostridiales bacterium]